MLWERSARYRGDIDQTTTDVGTGRIGFFITPDTLFVTERKRPLTLKQASSKGGRANTPAQRLARLRNMARCHALRAEKRQLKLDIDP